MDRLLDKVALITGGGGSIGAATARLFADEGAKVVLADVDEDGLAAVTDEIGAERAAYVVTDVTDSGQVREAVQIAVERFGGLDIAFANAGIFGEHTPIVDYPEDVFDAVMAVNVKGSFLVAKHSLPVMRDGGSLIFNSSVVGLFAEARASELFEERIPLGRHAAPEEIARSVLFLASDDSSFVTATTLTVDGGVKG